MSVLLLLLCLFFFFKQKTAYEMRISDWSSDVCSSDLPWLGNLMLVERKDDGDYIYRLYGSTFVNQFKVDMTGKQVSGLPEKQEIGRASCRERGCKYV